QTSCLECAESRSFLGRDLIRNFVILGLRHDAPRHQFAWVLIRTPRNYPACFWRSHARQAQQLFFCGTVQIERLVASPAPAYPCRHRLSMAIYLRRCLRGFLFQFLRVLLLSAAGERSQQQNCRNVPVSEEGHSDHFFPLSWLISQPSALSLPQIGQ